jgi:hypothetical protein
LLQAFLVLLSEAGLIAMERPPAIAENIETLRNIRARRMIRGSNQQN